MPCKRRHIHYMGLKIDSHARTQEVSVLCVGALGSMVMSAALQSLYSARFRVEGFGQLRAQEKNEGPLISEVKFPAGLGFRALGLGFRVYVLSKPLR